MFRNVSLTLSRMWVWLTIAACILAVGHDATAQSPASPRTVAGAKAAAPVSALLLSDIHFDPMHDPAKARLLNAAPLSEWAKIMAQPDTPTQAVDYAEINKVCPIQPLTDPTDKLWQSTLKELKTQAKEIGFLTLSGDIIGHRFDCRYRRILPDATHAQFVDFAEKTVRYVVDDLRAALPGVPFYLTLGNNDTVCSDNELAPENDEFLALNAKLVADALRTDAATHAEVLRDFPHGYYSAPLPAPMRNTRILVLDDVYAMATYKTCAGQPDKNAEQPELDWLAKQLDVVRARHEHAWVMGHVPPGINFYSTYNKHGDICTGAQPVSLTGSLKLAELLENYSDVVSLAVFGHSHTDEMRLLKPAAASLPGVAIKIVPSISPVFAELPSFTMGKIDPHSAKLLDYSVILASNSTGIDTTWAKSYTFSETYHQPAYTPEALTLLIGGFRRDPGAADPESAAYLREYRHYFYDDGSAPIKPLWPQLACTMDNLSPESFRSCACPAMK